MTYTVTIPLKLPSLNDYVNACRSHRMAGATLKKKTEARILPYLTPLPIFSGPIFIRCHWIDQNARRDIDNVSFAIKFLLDALQTAGKIPNDNRQYVRGLQHSFSVNKAGYAVILEIEEL